MLPHFKYLININVNSRNALLAEKGFLESVFTPNVWVTRIGSTLYKLWRFRKQPLPTELKNRCVVSEARYNGRILSARKHTHSAQCASCCTASCFYLLPLQCWHFHICIHCTNHSIAAIIYSMPSGRHSFL